MLGPALPVCPFARGWGTEVGLAPREGLEPPTRGLGRHRSIQLSYRGAHCKVSMRLTPQAAKRTGPQHARAAGP